MIVMALTRTLRRIRARRRARERDLWMALSNFDARPVPWSDSSPSGVTINGVRYESASVELRIGDEAIEADGVTLRTPGVYATTPYMVSGSYARPPKS